MSLASLTSGNYCTIETSEGASQTDDGSFDRAGSWTPIEQFKNIPCSIQEKSREITQMQYGQLDDQHKQVIYHRNEELWKYNPGDLTKRNQTQLRIITAINARNELTFPVAEHEILIYTWMGQIEQVKRNLTFYIIRCVQNNLWNR